MSIFENQICYASLCSYKNKSIYTKVVHVSHYVQQKFHLLSKYQFQTFVFYNFFGTYFRTYLCPSIWPILEDWDIKAQGFKTRSF